MPWLCCVILMGLIVATTAPAAAETEAPKTVVIDGDTIELNGEVVRLYGIDAPELGQSCFNGTRPYRCGFEAAVMLRKLIGNGEVECRPTPVDETDEGQICSVGLVDLAEAMLRSGYSLARTTSLTIYRRAESEAKQSLLGIWRGDFVPPAEWRAGTRLEIGDQGPTQTCDIKGIVGEGGERVYAVPSDAEYDAINIEHSRGDRLFCSDDEAELAGWRRWPKSVLKQRTT